MTSQVKVASQFTRSSARLCRSLSVILALIYITQAARTHKSTLKPWIARTSKSTTFRRWILRPCKPSIPVLPILLTHTAPNKTRKTHLFCVSRVSCVIVSTRMLSTPSHSDSTLPHSLAIHNGDHTNTALITKAHTSIKSADKHAPKSMRTGRTSHLSNGSFASGRRSISRL